MLHSSVFFPMKCYCTIGEGGRELFVANFLLLYTNNEATEMLFKSEPLETTPLMVSGSTRWDENGSNVEAWNPFQTQVKPALVCSVDRPSDCGNTCNSLVPDD